MAVRFRKIRFLQNMLGNPQVQAALVADGAINKVLNDSYVETDGQGDVVAVKSVVEYSDDGGDDYPNLRRALTQLNASYDFHQRRPDEGDNAIWHHGRNGKEIVANFGMSAEVVPLL